MSDVFILTYSGGQGRRLWNILKVGRNLQKFENVCYIEFNIWI
jgi:hypothetical protein